MNRVSPARNATFDQVGGFQGVTHAVARLYERMAADPELAYLIPPGSTEEARWQVELLLTDALGGPMTYDGPEPREVATRLGIDGHKARSLLDLLIASFQDAGADRAAEPAIRARCEAAAARFGVALIAGPAHAQVEQRRALIEGAVTLVRQAGLSGWNLFVLDPDLTVVHLSPDATRAALACDAELRYAFNLGAADLLGSSILRFHPAPTQLQGAFADRSRAPAETIWSFGRVVWKARLFPVSGAAGQHLGWAVPWRDESEAHRIDGVFQRLRAQAEELPVPIMFPDSGFERWLGNAACDEALERLAPYLPAGARTSGGFPIELFFPDPAVRQSLFRSPERLPYKTRLKLGPETIAILVAPVLDEEQRYLGPQITWEVVHFTRPEEQSPTRAANAGGAAVAASEATPAAQALRVEARGLETLAGELTTLIGLLDTIADHADAQAYQEPVLEPSASGNALQDAEAAVARAVGLVRQAAVEAAVSLASETRSVTGSLGAELRKATGRAQARAQALERFVSLASGLSEIRASLGSAAAELGPEEVPR